MSAALVVEAVVSALILTGAFFTLTGSIAMVRFPDFFLRLHGPTKATTLGVGALLLASALFFSWEEGYARFQEVLIMLFLFMTAPVSAHLLAKAALHLGVECRPRRPRKRADAAGWSGARSLTGASDPPSSARQPHQDT